MYLKQIEQLVALQRVDSEILDINDDLEAAPKEVEALQASYDAVKAELDKLQEKVDLLKEQEQRLVNEIEDDTLKIKKSKNKLMMVSNTKEYHAMMREMDNLEKLNRMREEERLTITDELKQLDATKEELDEKTNSLKDQLDDKKDSLQKRIDKYEAELQSLDNQRKNAGKSVPNPVLGRYEFIRSRITAPVIVPVEEGVCGGCHISIPPQSFIELQKGQQILSCPNCQRLIYWCEHFAAPVEDKKKKKKTKKDEQPAEAAEA